MIRRSLARACLATAVVLIGVASSPAPAPLSPPGNGDSPAFLPTEVGSFGLQETRDQGSRTQASFEPTGDARVARPAPPDTLRHSVSAGNPLIVALPDRVQDQPVTRYALLRAPALSAVAGRSFAWITRSADAGAHDVLLTAVHADAPADTIVLRVDVE